MSSSLSYSSIFQDLSPSLNITLGADETKSLNCLPPSYWEMNPLSAIMFFIFICMTIFLQHFKKRFLRRRSKRHPANFSRGSGEGDHFNDGKYISVFTLILPTRRKANLCPSFVAW
jgi:hypothetical protein